VVPAVVSDIPQILHASSNSTFSAHDAAATGLRLGLPSQEKGHLFRWRLGRGKLGVKAKLSTHSLGDARACLDLLNSLLPHVEEGNHLRLAWGFFRTLLDKTTSAPSKSVEELLSDPGVATKLTELQEGCPEALLQQVLFCLLPASRLDVGPHFLLTRRSSCSFESGETSGTTKSNRRWPSAVQ